MRLIRLLTLQQAGDEDLDWLTVDWQLARDPAFSFQKLIVVRLATWPRIRNGEDISRVYPIPQALPQMARLLYGWRYVRCAGVVGLDIFAQLRESLN